MTTPLRRDEGTEYRHEIVEEERMIVPDSGLDPAVDRREEVQVYDDGVVERREHVVRDTGREREAQLRRIAQFIWLLTGMLELLIGLRVILKLIAANPNAPFAMLVYGLSDLFLWPFLGLTVTPAAGGMVFELSSIIAMLVYAALAFGLVKLIYLLFRPSRRQRISVYRRD